MPPVLSWARARPPPVRRSMDSRKGRPITTPPARSRSRRLTASFFMWSSTSPGRRVPPVTEGIAPGDFREPGLGAIAVLLRRRKDGVHAWGIAGLDPPAQRIRQHVLGNTTDEGLLLFHQNLFQLARLGELLPGRKHAVRQHGLSLDLGAPAPDRVEVLQREAHRVDRAVTAGADGVLAVLLQLLAKGQALHGGVIRRQRRDVGRGRLGRIVEQRLQNPLSANYGARPGGMAGER